MNDFKKICFLDKNSPVFTTMNPILSCAESDSDTSGLLFRDRGDGDGLDEDEDSGVKVVHDDSDIINNDPDSDFDEFDSNEDDEPSMEIGETRGSQDNEIQEIYFVQESKQTKILGSHLSTLSLEANIDI